MGVDRLYKNLINIILKCANSKFNLLFQRNKTCPYIQIENNIKLDVIIVYLLPPAIVRVTYVYAVDQKLKGLGIMTLISGCKSWDQNSTAVHETPTGWS